MKLRVSEERGKTSRRRSEEEQVAQSDSENEEPLGWRSRNKSAFVRNPKLSWAVSGGSQRSRSCTDQEEPRGVKLKVAPLLPATDPAGLDHSASAGILLSTENRRSASAPVTGPDRLLAWCAVMTSEAPPLQAERSVSPDSNDSISEELNHFKPIVCSPCTPPKRLPDGRLLEPTIVKSTPRNLSRSLHKATSYEASPAVLQKWRQIELDRQNLKVDCKATLTSPVMEVQEDGGAKSAAVRTRSTAASNKRKLDFESEDEVTGHLVKIRVPAIRFGEQVVGGAMDLGTPGSPELYARETLFGGDRSLSPFARTSGFQLCALEDRERPLRSPSGRSRKSHQKTRHLDSRQDERLVLRKIQQEQQDRSLALQLQRQLDQEERGRGPARDSYFLRSWKSSQGRRRRLRNSGPVDKML